MLTRIISIIIAVAFLFGVVVGAIWAVWRGSQDQPADLTQQGEIDTSAETLPDFEPLTEPLTELRFEDTEVGSGQSATADDTVTVTYIGALASTGEVVEVGLGETFGLGPENANLLEGWTQGLPGMMVGGIRRLFLPADLAYGEIGQPELGVPPAADMVYDFELLALADGGLEEGETLADFEPTVEPVTELVIEDRVEGSGDEEVKATDTVSVHYTGAFVTNGVVFDSSRRHGPDPATFPLSGVIEGWTEGLVGMKVGGQRRLLIPSAKAYGQAGSPPSIPPDADLVFDVELVSITPEE